MSPRYLFAILLCALTAVRSISDEASCVSSAADDAGPRAQSLLQTRHQAAESSTLLEQDSQFPRQDCPGGLAAVGRCWYLGEVGESCDAACGSRGLEYSFAAPLEDVTPLLVGHRPSAKLDPWLFVECYVPREDRYHPVNRNAWGVPEKTPPGELAQSGQFSYQTCRLACPCAAPAAAAAPAPPPQPYGGPALPPTYAPAVGGPGSGCEGGIFANDRCWYQSGTGDNCDNTCAAHGCGYRFAAPPMGDMVPLLVGHVPRQKLAPWKFLECHVPNEDRYHPYNPNAWGVPEKTPAGELASSGQHSYDTCRLSCPCEGNCLFTVGEPTPEPPTLPPVAPRFAPTPPLAPTAAPAKCNDGIGISALSRCWYLSNAGESCDATCADHGFAYLYASPIEDMIPKLLGHAPAGKSEPWLFVECYRGKEDIYNPSNPDAWGVPSKTPAGDQAQAGQYSDEACMLACPCAGAVAAPPPPATTTTTTTTAGYWPTAPPFREGCSGIPTLDRSGGPSPERCWFLSKKGESCDQTCSSFGAGCEYSYAALQEDITPLLVGHEPASKQNPWLFLECYVPEEDRYHPANANAWGVPEKTPAEELFKAGQYSYSSCRLACPCTGRCDGSLEEQDELCSWEPPKECAPSFTYKDAEYKGCAMWVDHPTPWCSHDEQHSGSWSPCERVCTTPAK